MQRIAIAGQLGEQLDVAAGHDAAAPGGATYRRHHPEPPEVTGLNPRRDQQRIAARHRQLVSTSMVTGTWLVITSNTADRARDCSMSSRSFSAGASPLIANRTMIRS